MRDSASTPPCGEVRHHDERLMGHALALGRRHLGRTWPNPSVGAVIVRERDGGAPELLGEAVTAPGGRPHAEPLAIARVGDGTRGATLYVSLEPCAHHGRTPPCADAVVAAGFARVVTALPDADPRVAGRGHARLRQAGIAVVTGIRRAEAARDHRGHLTRVRLGRPSVTLKLAQTADGFAGTPGARLLVTGDAANARTHLLRARHDAVAVGIGTAIADDPRLDVRLPGLAAFSPLRVVFDTRLRLPRTSRLAASARERPLWIVCGEDAPGDAAARLADLGAEIVQVGRAADGRPDLPAALAALGARGLTRLLCEGGPALADALAAADLIDEVWLATGPAMLRGPGLPAVGPALAAALGGRLRSARSLPAGPDRIEVFERTPGCSPDS